MSADSLLARFRTLASEVVPLPARGATPQRLLRIFDAGLEDLSLAKLIEAHWDAVGILDEAALEPAPGCTYAVWASEVASQPMVYQNESLSGVKRFCSGAGLVDRALVTADSVLLELDLRACPVRVTEDLSSWQTDAFRQTRTAALTFDAYPVLRIVGSDHWYTQRPGFWQGACGPAAAWAGGAAGLLQVARQSKRDDPHTQAHLGAMAANIAGMKTLLQGAGCQIDQDPKGNALALALTTRHLVEQLCIDTVTRFGRSMGPAPLAMDATVSRRVLELELFLRQCHGEQDLAVLGRAARTLHRPESQKTDGLT